MMTSTSPYFSSNGRSSSSTCRQLMQQNVQKSSNTILPRRPWMDSALPAVLSHPRPLSSGARTRIMSPILSDGLPADAEPEERDGARLRVADRFEVDPGQARGREVDAVAEQHRKYVHQDLVDETPLQALAGHVGAQDLQVLAARCVERRGHRFPEVTSEERDPRIRWVRRLVGKDEHGTGQGVLLVPRCRPPLHVHPFAYLVGTPTDEHGARGRRDLLDDGRVRRHEVADPVHRVTGSGD